tara:strand:- start:27 stop:410 length:384 start_codon:yes stop_codon:yes gene_type:complete
MINAEFLSQCSDEQINKGVAWAKIKSLPLIDKRGGRYELYRLFSNALIHDLSDYGFDPCEYPNDIMPIAFANNISIDLSKPYSDLVGDDAIINGKYLAYSQDIEFSAYNENYLRAICEVYILMSVNK